MADINEYTKVMLHMVGDDESPVFIDSAPTPHTVVANGSAQIDTDVTMMSGRPTGLFDGSTASLSAASSSLNAGTGAFCVDLRLYYTGTANTYPSIFANQFGSWQAGCVDLGIDPSGYADKVTFWVNDFNASVPMLVSTTSITASTETHVAVTRDGNTFRLFINGTKEDEETFVGSINFSGNGGWYVSYTGWNAANSRYAGNLKELRVQIGESVWTTDFTPPTTEYTGPIEVPALSAADSFLAPVITTVFPPALAAADTFVIPSYIFGQDIPALALSAETFNAPVYNINVSVPIMPTRDVLGNITFTGVSTTLRQAFPNMTGKHLSFKLSNSDSDGGFVLNYIRMKAQVYLERYDPESPNLSGQHITVTLTHSANASFLLEYASMGVVKYYE